MILHFHNSFHKTTLNRLKVAFFVLMISTFAIGCKKDEPVNNNNNNGPLVVDLNKMHSGSYKKWYWKRLDGDYENPLEGEENAYHIFYANGEVRNQASPDKAVYYWEFSPKKDDYDNTGTLYRKDVVNWFGMYIKTIEGNVTKKDYGLRRYEIVELTDTRFVIMNILGDGKTKRVYETTK